MEKNKCIESLDKQHNRMLFNILQINLNSIGRLFLTSNPMYHKINMKCLKRNWDIFLFILSNQDKCTKNKTVIYFRTYYYVGTR